MTDQIIQMTETIDDILKPLSNEELKKVKPINADQINAALKKGKEVADKFEETCYARIGYYR